MVEPKQAPGAMPRWVKVFIWIGVGVLILAVVSMLTGHGPWQHGAGMHS